MLFAHQENRCLLRCNVRYLQLSRPCPPKQLTEGVELPGQAALAARRGRSLQVYLVDVLVQTLEVLLQCHQRDLLRQVRVRVGHFVISGKIAAFGLQGLMMMGAVVRRMVMGMMMVLLLLLRMELQLLWRGWLLLQQLLMVVAILIVAGR